MEYLPAELLYEIHLFALSETLPFTNSHIQEVFKGASTSHRVAYLASKYEERYERRDKHGRKVVTSTRGPIGHALLFPLCTEPVLDALFRYYSSRPPDPYASRIDSWAKETQLPRRLFSGSNLSAAKPDGRPLRSSDPPLPFLKHLYDLFSTYTLSPPPDANAHGGYALTRAVFTGHLPLVLFLLSVGARPAENNSLAVRVAIRKRDLKLVRVLVEGGSTEEYAVDDRSGVLKVKAGVAGKKRRRIGDRVDVNTTMLKEAVEVSSSDIVRYLLDRGARPDIQVMEKMQKSGFM
ncbi:hypothetical protein SCHPADRAFT_273348 [Schizopora paradoxa]|uniref:Ankyrin n=1 Tax=Schizopora paradoxa TaxID=27342 RepID=A0A0H2SDY9_9AGAM|nr:hypothetical protein SCHPADRAFT_273348 [Schizopora paradoxa]